MNWGLTTRLAHVLISEQARLPRLARYAARQAGLLGIAGKAPQFIAAGLTKMNNHKLEKPVILPIKKVIQEGPDYKTFILDGGLEAKPGQFAMLWIPGLDAKPFSFLYADKKEIAFTIKRVGPFTKKLFSLKPTNLVGIFGPYGNHFDLKKYKHILAIGAGCGAPPVAFLNTTARKRGVKVDYLAAGSQKEDLILLKHLIKYRIKIYHKFNWPEKNLRSFELFKQLIAKNKYEAVYACGPELLLKKIVDLCQKKKIPCHVSLERYMKCGFGVCGQCCLDDTGWCVCKDGPVFTGEQLAKVKEFGKYHRDGTGGKIAFSPSARLGAGV